MGTSSSKTRNETSTKIETWHQRCYECGKYFDFGRKPEPIGLPKPIPPDLRQQNLSGINEIQMMNFSSACVKIQQKGHLHVIQFDDENEPRCIFSPK